METMDQIYLWKRLYWQAVGNGCEPGEAERFANRSLPWQQRTSHRATPTARISATYATVAAGRPDGFQFPTVPGWTGRAVRPVERTFQTGAKLGRIRPLSEGHKASRIRDWDKGSRVRTSRGSA
jgi:hypothetical protein